MLGHMHAKSGNFKKKKLYANTITTSPHPDTASSPHLIEDNRLPEIPNPVKPFQNLPTRDPQPPIPMQPATSES